MHAYPSCRHATSCPACIHERRTHTCMARQPARHAWNAHTHTCTTSRDAYVHYMHTCISIDAGRTHRLISHTLPHPLLIIHAVLGAPWMPWRRDGSKCPLPSMISTRRGASLIRSTKVCATLGICMQNPTHCSIWRVRQYVAPYPRIKALDGRVTAAVDCRRLVRDTLLAFACSNTGGQAHNPLKRPHGPRLWRGGAGGR